MQSSKDATHAPEGCVPEAVVAAGAGDAGSVAAGLEGPQSATSRYAVRELLLLAAPTVAQMASYTIAQFTDTVMLARVGTVPATAAANAGLFAFSVISFGVGVLLVVNTLVSQAFGKGDLRATGRFLWAGVWFAVAYSAVVLPFLPLVGGIFAGLGHEPELARMEAVYFQITVALTVVKLGATALGQFLLAVNRPNLVLVAALSAVVVNIFANWVLIFGNLGMPAMGVAGAAWGTNIAVAVELAILAAFVFSRGVRGLYHSLDWRFRWDSFGLLLKVGVPSGVQIVADVLAWSMWTMWVLGLFGTPTMAASNFVLRYMSVSFMPAFGISTAVTALVGRYIGMGRLDIARQRAHLGFFVTAVYMISCGLLFALAREPLMGVFSSDPEVVKIGATLLIVAGVYQFFDAMFIVYNGGLRGAGDTLVPAVVTGVLCWSMVVGGGYAVGKLMPELGAVGPWLVAALYGLVLGCFMLWRFLRLRPKVLVVDEPAGRDKVTGFDPVAV